MINPIDTESANAHSLIENLRSAISDGAAGLFDALLLVRQIIEGALWQQRFVPETKKTVTFHSFEEFVCQSLPEGLGASKKILFKLCAGDVETLDALDCALQGTSHGGDRRSKEFKSDNVKLEIDGINSDRYKSGGGNSIIYALRRLRKSRPDLHRRVLEKEASINQAMIEAGFRRQSMVIQIDVIKVGETIKKHFTRQQISELIKLLDD